MHGTWPSAFWPNSWRGETPSQRPVAGRREIASRLGSVLLTLVRRLIPTRLRRALVRTVETRRSARRARREPQRDPAVVFGEVYERGIWGRGETAYYSGGGSDARYAEPYCQAVRDLLATTEHHRPVIVDLGCGDFRVGRALIDGWDVDYVGVDVVPALIEFNSATYGSEHVRFVCRDLVTDPLPPGDICLVRQVLQHLSNDQIRRVLPKLDAYAHVIVTEHYPADEATAIPNLDKAPGADTRLSANSAVYLDEAPFRRSIRPLLSLPAETGTIRTFLLTGNPE